MAFLQGFEHLKLQLDEIKSATDNFGDNNVIGKGGFGKVYKGEISHSKGRSIVAFKRLDRTHGQGDPEFWKEIMMLSRYTHENLVSLLGFCNDGVEMILAYEYASHGSLDRCISSTDLTWTQRLKICLGAASGLSYLHDPQGTQQRVLHRDIKSANILLDENWSAKLSDLGLSKIGPANQQYTVLVSNAVGTPGYCDPMYIENGFLTKESDVYSFGVVLFEVMCGRLCYENLQGVAQILVRMWRQSYEQKKLEDIIFHGLREQMDKDSLNTFSAIAYRCLQRSHEERPKMAEVVTELEIALEFQESYEDVKQPLDYKEIVKNAVPPLIYRSKRELNLLLSKGILLNEGKTWFSLNKNGENCEMISAAKILFPLPGQIDFNRLVYAENSRFPDGTCYESFGNFIVRVRTQFLSPQITYTINLVFKWITENNTSSELTYIALKYKLDGERKSSISYLADRREDGWLMTELYQFTSYRKTVDLEILFEGSADGYNYTLVVEGIEFLPVEKVKQEELEDESVDMQSLSDLDTDWEQKLPKDYQELIKRSKYRMQWTNKKELYFLLCKGFLINNGEKWFSLGKNGKKCHMLPARAALLEEDWTWKFVPKSRFLDVAVSSNTSFRITCKIKSQILSPQTTYASYLVYKLPENHSKFKAPVKVKDKDFQKKGQGVDDVRIIYLLSPQTPVIRPTLDQNTHNPTNRPKMKGLPKVRSDGWMEVQVWEFRTGATTKTTLMCIDLTTFNNRLLNNLIVQGIEFKPI